MQDIPCIIFAGGKSSRMGRDKALLPFGSFSTLCEFQHSRLSKIFSNVYISCKDRNKFNFEANFIEDSSSIDTFAPTIGFISAFEQLPNKSFFAISVDSPFINEEIIKILLSFSKEGFDAVVARTSQGIQPLCGFYSDSLEKKFLQMQKEDNHKLTYLLKLSNTHFVDFQDKHAFLNLNYPDEYQQALSSLKYDG